MKLDNFNWLGHDNNNQRENTTLANFIKDVQNVVSNFIKNTCNNNISQDSIYVVRDINDEKISLVNIENGKNFDIYAVTSSKQIEDLHSKGIVDNIFEISTEDFYSLNLGSNIIIQHGKCKLYPGEINIENPEAKAKLEDMYFCLEQEKDSIYSISEISSEKIYLTDTKEGGYFSIPRDAYPNFKVGDFVKNIDGKYTLI